MDAAAIPNRPVPALWVRAGVVVSVCAAMVVLLWLDEPLWISWFKVLSATEFALAWALFCADRRLAPNAGLCLLVAVLIVVSDVGTGYNGPSQLIGFVVTTVVAAPAALLLLRYPLAVLPTTVDRVFIAVLSVWAVGGQLAIAAVWTPDPATREWWPTILHGNHLVDPVTKIVDIGLAVIAVVGLVLVARRALRAARPDRRELIPVSIAGVIYALTATVTCLGWAFAEGSARDWLESTSLVAYVLIPIAFVTAAVQRRLAQARVADFAARVSASQQPTADPQDLLVELKQVLDDPQLEIYYWIQDGYVSSDGTAAPSVPPDRLEVPISGHDERRLAVLFADPSLARHRDLLDAVVASAALALENARLHTALLAQLAQATSAQQRIVEAGLTERRRIERDLHDGAQQRLLAASMTLARAHDAPADTLALLDVARGQVRDALAELRDLARGIHPAVLSQSGLAAAVESLAEHSPVAVQIGIPPQRWTPAAESTAYFVVAESLANAAKHAPQSSVTVHVTDGDGNLRVQVRDDGPGTADPARGSGLVGLRDRVNAIGGRLEISSQSGLGTCIEATIPCE